MLKNTTKAPNTQLFFESITVTTIKESNHTTWSHYK